MKLKLAKTSLIQEKVNIFNSNSVEEVVVEEIEKNNLKVGEIYECIYHPESYNRLSGITIYNTSNGKWITIYSKLYGESVIQLFEPV